MLRLVSIVSVSLCMSVPAHAFWWIPGIVHGLCETVVDCEQEKRSDKFNHREKSPESARFFTVFLRNQCDEKIMSYYIIYKNMNGDKVLTKGIVISGLPEQALETSYREFDILVRNFKHEGWDEGPDSMTGDLLYRRYTLNDKTYTIEKKEREFERHEIRANSWGSYTYDIYCRTLGYSIGR